MHIMYMRARLRLSAVHFPPSPVWPNRGPQAMVSSSWASASV